MKVMARTLYAR